MANKRDLKRSLNYACSDLFTEGIAAYVNTTKENKSQVDTVLKSILKIHSDYVRRVSHPEPGMKPKKYYSVLVSDFNKQACELINQLEAL